MSLFDPIDVGAMRLNNRIVMAPMTRARNPDNIAGPLNVTYYGQRASAGLIVTKGSLFRQRRRARSSFPASGRNSRLAAGRR